MCVCVFWSYMQLCKHWAQSILSKFFSVLNCMYTRAEEHFNTFCWLKTGKSWNVGEQLNNEFLNLITTATCYLQQYFLSLSFIFWRKAPKYILWPKNVLWPLRSLIFRQEILWSVQSLKISIQYKHFSFILIISQALPIFIHPPTHPPSQVIYNMATNMLPVFIVSYAVFFYPHSSPNYFFSGALSLPLLEFYKSIPAYSLSSLTHPHPRYLSLRLSEKPVWHKKTL